MGTCGGTKCRHRSSKNMRRPHRVRSKRNCAAVKTHLWTGRGNPKRPKRCRAITAHMGHTGLGQNPGLVYFGPKSRSARNFSDKSSGSGGFQNSLNPYQKETIPKTPRAILGGRLFYRKDIFMHLITYQLLLTQDSIVVNQIGNLNPT